jgi:thiamine pyrophosphate-dependent acetolactate synthase large subunit-like protein
MRMHGMEVQSAARAGLPVIYLVSNNQALGNVWLRARKEGPTPSRLTEAPDQDWAGFARALGAEGLTVRKADELAPALRHRRQDGSNRRHADRAVRRAANVIERFGVQGLIEIVTLCGFYTLTAMVNAGFDVPSPHRTQG